MRTATRLFWTATLSTLTLIALAGNGFAQAPAAEAAPKTEAAQPVSGESPVKVYVITLRGELGRDVTKTPMTEALKDAKKNKADVLVIKVDTAFSVHQKVMKDFDDRQAGQAFNQLETVRELETLFTDSIRDDKEWAVNTPTGKPRLVMWVKKALGGAAFLPWSSPEIYFTGDGRMGGVGYMEYMFRNGDFAPIMKQLSLRLGRAKGLAEKGGHEPKLIEAMTWTSYVLSVNYVGDQPVYVEDASGEDLLTDDGDPKTGHADAFPDIMRFQGNDVLTLDAAKAFKVKLSKGTANNLEDLCFELDIARNYVEIKGRSDAIFKDWSSKVNKAEEEFQDTVREYQQIQVQGATPAERNKLRSRQMSLLNKAREILKKYKESVNPEALGDPENIDGQIDLLIERIRQQIRLDK